MYKVLSAESYSGEDTAASVAANQKSPSKSFSQSFISSGKQGGGATIPREERDM
jgi:hypothetical protein